MEKRDPYAHHKLIYDIIDEAVFIRAETLRLSKEIDPTQTLTNAQQGLLGMIYRYEGSTQSELAQIYQRDSKNIIKGVSELVRRGLVEKGQEDLKKPLYLTDAGRRINDHLMRERGAMIEHLLAEIELEELEAAKDTLKKIAERMTAYIDDL